MYKYEWLMKYNAGVSFREPSPPGCCHPRRLLSPPPAAVIRRAQARSPGAPPALQISSSQQMQIHVNISISSDGGGLGFRAKCHFKNNICFNTEGKRNYGLNPREIHFLMRSAFYLRNFIQP